MNTIKRKYVTLIVLGVASLANVLIHTSEAADSCSTRLVSVVAHLDDDLLFINPEIIRNFDNQACITTVHVIGGRGAIDMYSVSQRETALKKAYARMAHLPNEWTIDKNIPFAGKYVTRMTLNNANSKVEFLELRLQGGYVRGDSPLQQLWELNKPMSSQTDSGDIRSTYNNRDELIATLLAIMNSANPTKISTLNPDTIPWTEHPDHIYAARFTREVARLMSNNIPISYYETYPTASRPINLYGQELVRKRDIAATYFSADYEGGIFTENHWNGNWVGRNYHRDGLVHDILPNEQVLPFELANVLTTQCLTSAGLNTTPYLSACTGSVAQKWSYQPNQFAVGQKGNAHLVSYNNNCIATNGLGFLEVSCSTAANQDWTPWDFGLVRVPGWSGNESDPENKCFSVDNNGSLTTSKECNTAASRWAPTSDSMFHDLRQENALVDDFTGDGIADTLIVQRASDAITENNDAGFNVYVRDSTVSGLTMPLWYKYSINKNNTGYVTTDTDPCTNTGLCFDNSRFLSGDFDGDKKPDLMVVSPFTSSTGIGTRFWLMSNQNNATFNPPVLWKELNNTFDWSLAQQYVSADFNGDGMTDVLIAHHRGDSGLNLWVLTSTKSSANDPQLWYQGISMSAAANLKPAMLHTGNLKSDLLSFEDGKPALKIRPIINSGTKFTSTVAKNFKPLDYLSSKPIVGDINEDGLSEVVVLHKRSDGPKINVWQIPNIGNLSQPTFLGAVDHTAWADQIPYLITRESQKPLLNMVARSNSVFIPSEGNLAAAVNYWRLGGVEFYTHEFEKGPSDPTFDTKGSFLGELNSTVYFQDILQIERLSK
jgi:hypothetical protein